MLHFVSTNGNAPRATLREAVLAGLAPDDGLYMPENIASLADDFVARARGMSFPEVSFEVAHTLLDGAVEDDALRRIIEAAIDFDAPLVGVDDRTWALELFHGPTLAFKDFGARFMAGLLEHFVAQSGEKITVLVATSGDTGSAVASGLHGIDGVHVVILFPSGKVSAIQQRQLTTQGDNVTALEVGGTFDDCQRMVKSAFADEQLRAAGTLTSANSINVARLIPQTFYYAYACVCLGDGSPVIFSVPCGNYGNITAGLFVKRMRLPIGKFVAATNANDIVPSYLRTGEWAPRAAVATISNAMDVGDPSNFARINAMYDSLDALREDLEGVAFTDAETLSAIEGLYKRSGYVMDPHGAVAWLGLVSHMKTEAKDTRGVFLETAHPAKFRDVLPASVRDTVETPPRLVECMNRPERSVPIAAEFGELKQFLMR